MNRILSAALLALSTLVPLTGCTSKTNATEVGKPPVAVEVQKLAAQSQTDALDVVGSLSPRFEAAVKPEYTATVVQVYVTQWVRVRRGQPLAKLDAREVEVGLQKANAGVGSAKAALLQAQVRASQAARESERAEQLKANGLATQQQLDDAHSNREAAAAAVSAAEGQLRLAEEEVRQAQTRLDKATLRAPMDGIVSERNASPGDVVGEPGGGQVPFRIVDNRVLDLTVTVPASRLADLRVGQPLEFTVDALPGRTFAGRIAFINPSVDEASRSVKVIAEVDNTDDALRGGLFARGRIVVGERTNVLAAPREALLAWNVDQGTGDLFIVDGDVARRRAVKTGRVTGGVVEVTSGLAIGDLVVARGGFNLHDGDRVKIVQQIGG